MAQELKDALALLRDEGVEPPAEAEARLQQHARLVAEWNSYASLVSRGDATALLSRHTVDALSLAPLIARHAGSEGVLLDIGSGGGFPALPLKLVLPDLPLVLLERSSKKVGVLRRLLVALALKDVDLRNGLFPQQAQDLAPTVITARAVERPAALWSDLAAYLRPGQVFLCQTGLTDLLDPAVFHVEHVKDEWTRRGWRRSSLHLISHRATP